MSIRQDINRQLFLIKEAGHCSAFFILQHYHEQPRRHLSPQRPAKKTA